MLILDVLPDHQIAHKREDFFPQKCISFNDLCIFSILNTVSMVFIFTVSLISCWYHDDLNALKCS
uniref:Uncharacterized protein n=1 Tax=Anguilla anguilla TaxID=7936 RepID=A0A0E9RB12_ANGAN